MYIKSIATFVKYFVYLMVQAKYHQQIHIVNDENKYQFHALPTICL